MTEFEKKLLLTEDEYDYLMEHLGYESPLIQKPVTTQINYYFDTDDFSMDRQNITCRIRFKDGRYTATMKKHLAETDQNTEIEMTVRDGIRDNTFIDMGMKFQGELITQRCVVFKDSNCEAVLDKNEYLGHSDYELEIEYLPEHEAESQAIYHVILDVLTRRKHCLAHKASNNTRPDAPCKSSRFFERKKKDELDP